MPSSPPPPHPTPPQASFQTINWVVGKKWWFCKYQESWWAQTCPSLVINKHTHTQYPSPRSLPTSELHADTTGRVLALPIWLYSYVLCLVAQSCLTLCDPMDCSLPGFSVHGDSLGKYIGVGCHTFLQGIFPTQGSNPGLPRCMWILYHLSHQGSPPIWVLGFFLKKFFLVLSLQSPMCILQLQHSSISASHISKLLLLLSHVSRVRLCNPIDGSPQGSLAGLQSARSRAGPAGQSSGFWPLDLQRTLCCLGKPRGSDLSAAIT